MIHLRIRKIELDGLAVSLDFDNGDGIVGSVRTDTLNRIKAMILDDMEVNWDHGTHGPEAHICQHEWAENDHGDAYCLYCGEDGDA